MLEVKVEKCAGIDVGKKFLAVCILIGLAKQKPVGEVRRFGTSVKELERLRTWLLESGCTEVVMESTGSYWKPVFNILEGSLKVILANPEQVKALRGKKSDPNDSAGWWAMELRKRTECRRSWRMPTSKSAMCYRMSLEAPVRRCWKRCWKTSRARQRSRNWDTGAWRPRFR